MHERESYAARIRDTPENRKSACYSFQFNRRSNRTALVVTRTLHRTRICARHVCGTTVSQENGHDSATSFIDRDVETLQERNICPSFRSPLPSHTRPSFLHEFQLAGRRSKRMVGAALVWRKETTNARSVSRFNSGKRNSFFFSVSVHRIFNI